MDWDQRLNKIERFGSFQTSLFWATSDPNEKAITQQRDIQVAV